jgi:hypothetical protein
VTILTDRLAVAAEHVESRPTIGSGWRDPRLAQAMQRFLNAHAAAEEACVGLTRAQAAGVDPLPRVAAFLVEAANSAWQEALALAGEDADSVQAEAESELGAASMHGYSRRRRSGHVVAPTFSSWEESVGNLNWSTGRAA